jgi:hypothetical protein
MKSRKKEKNLKRRDMTLEGGKRTNKFGKAHHCQVWKNILVLKDKETMTIYWLLVWVGKK